MKRIPFGGLKLKKNPANFIYRPDRDNEENPLRGIETFAHNANATTPISDNEENPLRGIETCVSKACSASFLCSPSVTMKRIPFGGLKHFC